MEKVSELWNSIWKPAPTLEEQIQQKRNASFEKQQGIENQLKTYRLRLGQLNAQLAATPESNTIALNAIFQEMTMVERQISNLTNSLSLLTKSVQNMNNTKSNVDALSSIHETNQMVNAIVDASKKGMGVTPERVLTNMQTATQRVDSLSTMIEDASANVSQSDLDQHISRQDNVSTEMARYRSELTTSAALAKRNQLLSATPEIPSHTGLQAVAVPMPAGVISSPSSSQDSVKDPWTLFVTGK
jgi:hypothetical protein